MEKLAATFIFGGFLLTFGAVGGMEHQPDADFLQQLAAAAAGLFFMFVGTRLIPQDQTDK